MDGFWAFELERRGAGEVVAIDLVDPERHDSPFSRRHGPPTPPRALRGTTFRLAADLLGSRADYRDLSVYDLDPGDIGEFDVVVMGYVLQMLRDPLRALEAVRGVCRGHLLLLETVSLPLSLVPSPLARLDARRDGSEWFVFNRRGLRKALELAGFEVEVVTPIFRDHYGPPRVASRSRRERARCTSPASVADPPLPVHALFRAPQFLLVRVRGCASRSSRSRA